MDEKKDPLDELFIPNESIKYIKQESKQEGKKKKKPNWLCFLETNVSSKKGYRGHGCLFSIPSCETSTCSCHGYSTSKFFPDSVTVVWFDDVVQGVFIDEKDAEEFCKKYNLEKAVFFTSCLYPKKEDNSMKPILCDWKECNEIAIKRISGKRMLCKKHAIEGGWIKEKSKGRDTG